MATQLPCAEIQLADATLTVTYGAKSGNCIYKGHTFSGSHSIHVQKNDQAQVLVHHEWKGLSNGRVKLDGTADVTWDFEAKSRQVVHSVKWTRVNDGFSVTGEGYGTQTPLAGGVLEGIEVTVPLVVQQPGPVGPDHRRRPDALGRPGAAVGSYTLLTPKKTLSLSFERVDEDTIKVTVGNGKRSFNFDVTKIGSVKSS